MKSHKYSYFLILALFFIVVLASAVTVRAQTVSDRPSGWTQSLREIELTVSALVEKNAQLLREQDALNRQIEEVGAGVLQQKDQNGVLQANLEQLKLDLQSPKRGRSNGSAQSGLEREVAMKRTALKTLQMKLEGLENRINLRKIKLDELALQQQAAVIDRQSGEKPTTAELRAEVDSLRREVESQVEQEKIVRGKLEALLKNEQAFAGQDKDAALEMSDLRQQLSDTEVQEKDLLAQLSSSEDRRSGYAQDGDVLRYKILFDEKKVMEEQVAELEAKVKDAERGRSPDPKLIADMKREAAALESQNKMIITQVDDLRENIAVLEYKVSSLERYKNRNISK